MRTTRRMRGTLVGAAFMTAALATQVIGAPPAEALAPTVLAFLPPSGTPGTSVTITGLGFDDTSVVTGVAFHGTPATFSVGSDLQITATVPAGATTGTISVTDSEGTGSSLLSFTVTPPAAPTVVAFLPVSGPVGTSVAITGTGFTGATGVSFGGVAATAFTVNSGTQIHATVPTGAMSGSIQVTGPGGTGTSATSFTVTTASSGTTITSFSPASGGAGMSVAITGTGFTGATDVTLDGTSATFTVDSATQAHATVPATATTGPIAIVTPIGTGTSTTNFIVTTGSAHHARAVKLRLHGRLKVNGRLVAGDGFAACVGNVPVKIQRKRRHGWRTIASGTTDASGRFKGSLKNRRGIYRAIAPTSIVGGGTDVCDRGVSRKVHHRVHHR